MTLQPARPAIADTSRRSAGSASSSNSDRIRFSLIRSAFMRANIGQRSKGALKGLGAAVGLVMARSSLSGTKLGNDMAEEEPILTDPPNQDVAVQIGRAHV